jgi:hypothetical protein
MFTLHQIPLLKSDDSIDIKFIEIKFHLSFHFISSLEFLEVLDEINLGLHSVNCIFLRNFLTSFQLLEEEPSHESQDLALGI